MRQRRERVVVYTAWTGQYEDQVRPPRCGPCDNVEFYCYTDDPHWSVPGWTPRLVPPAPCPALQARRIKILGQQLFDADISLWLDASFELYVDPRQIIDRWIPPANIVALPHPDRQTYIEEGHEIVRLGLAPADAIERQITQYTIEGFDASQQQRITSTGFLLRRHTAGVLHFNRTWWHLFEAAGHTRDQMSVDYALWLTGQTPAYIGGHYRDNPYARYYRPTPKPVIEYGVPVELLGTVE